MGKYKRDKGLQNTNGAKAKIECENLVSSGKP